MCKERISIQKLCNVLNCTYLLIDVIESSKNGVEYAICVCPWAPQFVNRYSHKPKNGCFPWELSAFENIKTSIATDTSSGRKTLISGNLMACNRFLVQYIYTLGRILQSLSKSGYFHEKIVQMHKFHFRHGKYINVCTRMHTFRKRYSVSNSLGRNNVNEGTERRHSEQNKK